MIDPNFPLVDLHRHLDGSVRLETILDLGRQHNLEMPAWDVEGLRPYVQVIDPQPGVMAFIEKFKLMTAILVDYDACHRVAYENVADAQQEGLDYVELRFSPWFMASGRSLDPAGIVEAVCDGIAEGQRDFGVRTNLIGILSRTYGPEIAWKELDALLTQKEHLVAIDLAGDEANFPGELFVDHIHKAVSAGWGITVHAGESAGPESIWQAVQDLGAARIGHGVTAIQDLGLMNFLVEREIGVECNLTSNLQTSTVANYANHPIREFLERGILATINTDDPGISNIDLAYEYNVAAPAAGLRQEQIHQAQRNAVLVAFLSPDEKAALTSSHKSQT
jgi:adenosine deaminase